jgi:hypothetical protein
MTSLPFAQIDTPFADSAGLKRAPAPNGAAFVLLLLMTPIVLIHPQEVWPSLGTVPLFQLLVLACTVHGAIDGCAANYRLRARPFLRCRALPSISSLCLGCPNVRSRDLQIRDLFPAARGVG